LKRIFPKHELLSAQGRELDSGRISFIRLRTYIRKVWMCRLIG